jgi:L-alanine-DL-glutamate epimerase-like enolase superfamily enzyme
MHLRGRWRRRGGRDDRPRGDHPPDRRVYTFPTAQPEADGTLRWDSTTAVTVNLEARGCVGLGWTYSSPAAATVIRSHLAAVVQDRDAFDIPAGFSAMRSACRNFGTRGLVMQAISAVDIAWWDLKARLFGVPLSALFGRVRHQVPVYGSGGFTTLSERELDDQVRWRHSVGCTAMKIKIGESWGTRIDRDLARVGQLRAAAGPKVELMADANGGYSVGQACRVGGALDELGIVWFEEPVSSDDTRGLATVRGSVRADVAAGEYAADECDVARLLPVLDCLQLDVTRCGGYTGWLRCAAQARAANREVSGHCAPSLHAAVAASIPHLRHVEWFADHARLEPLLVDGAPEVHDGALHPHADRPGHGMTISAQAQQWCVG